LRRGGAMPPPSPGGAWLGLRLWSWARFGLGWALGPEVAAPERAVGRMLAMARVGEGDVVVDVGSGDGRVVRAAASLGARRAIGYEVGRGMHRASVALRDAMPDPTARARVELVLGDVLALGPDAVRGATAVTLYLSERGNVDVARRVLAPGLGEGARVVSCAFPIRGLTADAREECDGVSLYLFRVRPGWADTLGDATVGDEAGRFL